LTFDEHCKDIIHRHSRIYENAFFVKPFFLAVKMMCWWPFPLSGLPGWACRG
jgi:hypothetical protein